MHEYSLVSALLAQLCEAASPHAQAAVEEVVIEIGPLAGVEPLLVASAFEVLTCGTTFGATRLIIEQAPLRLTCNSCGRGFETQEATFACPTCSSLDTRVVAGDAVMLQRFVLREPQPEEATP